jgi:hypothetical protein
LSQLEFSVAHRYQSDIIFISNEVARSWLRKVLVLDSAKEGDANAITAICVIAGERMDIRFATKR